MIQRDSMVGLYGAEAPRIQLRWHWLLAWVLLIPGLSYSAELEGSARFQLSTGVDSNAPRGFGGIAPDGVASLQAAGTGAIRGESWQLDGSYEAGARKFLIYPSEDSLVQQASVQGMWRWARPLLAGLDAGAKDRRGAGRSYTDLSGRAFLSFSPEARVEVRASGGARRYWFHPQALYSFLAWEGSLSARYRLDRHHAFSVLGDFGQRRYDGQARPRPDGASPGQRRDLVLGAGVGWSYRGPFTATFGYTFFDQGSNSYGERMTRHRLTATGGVRLAPDLMLLAQASVQLTSYPDGIYLSPEQQLAEDDENHNSLSLKLLRPLTDRLDLELKGAGYQNVLPQNGQHYLRLTLGLGLSFRL